MLFLPVLKGRVLFVTLSDSVVGDASETVKVGNRNSSKETTATVHIAATAAVLI